MYTTKWWYNLQANIIAKDELNKADTNGHAKVDLEIPKKPQSYEKDYR